MLFPNARIGVVSLMVLGFATAGHGQSPTSSLTTVSSAVHMSLEALSEPQIQVASSFDLNKADVCWRDTNVRGVGTIPTECSGDKDAGLCYPKCPAGYTGVGPVCWQSCPSGFTDTGGHCLKPAPYGRGGGYAWKFGDALNDNGMRGRCESDNGRGNCEKDGLIFYPKCKAGFHKEGCCICTPDCPSGMTDIGVSCQKQSSGRGVGSLMSCGNNLDFDAGLCYNKCPAGKSGVGPVCWDSCPTQFPVNCGASCAKTADACALSVSSQIRTPLEVVTNIVGAVVTGGGSTAAKAGAGAAGKTAATAAVKATLKQQLIAAAKKAGKELAEAAAESAASTLAEAQATGEFDFTGLDPTGITAVVDAYYKPVCSDAVRRIGVSTPVSAPSACITAAQGKVAPDNITRLCGTSATAEPVKCFQRLMTGTISWGGGTQWQPGNAVNLCSQVGNADVVIACFQTRVVAGDPWSSAIPACNK